MKLIIEVTKDYYAWLKVKADNCRANVSDITILDGKPYEEKGKWITDERGYVCSECGALHSDDYPFCHMCGADMRKEASDV